MPEPVDREEQPGFAFTEDDFRRRYAGEEQSLDGPRASSPSAHGASRSGVHGGGNSYMRALRRRLAAAADSG